MITYRFPDFRTKKQTWVLVNKDSIFHTRQLDEIEETILGGYYRLDKQTFNSTGYYGCHITLLILDNIPEVYQLTTYHKLKNIPIRLDAHNILTDINIEFYNR